MSLKIIGSAIVVLSIILITGAIYDPEFGTRQTPIRAARAELQAEFQQGQVRQEAKDFWKDVYSSCIRNVPSKSMSICTTKANDAAKSFKKTWGK